MKPNVDLISKLKADLIKGAILIMLAQIAAFAMVVKFLIEPVA